MTENTKGFEIAYNLRAKMLRIRVWGKEWDPGFEKKYAMGMQDRIMRLNSPTQREIWYVLADFRDLSASLEKAQQVTRAQLATAKNLGVKKIAYIQNQTDPESPLNHPQDKPVQAIFNSTEQAMEWLVDEEKEALLTITPTRCAKSNTRE